MLYRTFMELTPHDIIVAEDILKEEGIQYLKEWNTQYNLWWVMFITPTYDVPSRINSAIGINGKLNGKEVSA